MFFNELEPHEKEYRVVEILPEHFEHLCEAIRNELQLICFGEYFTVISPRHSTYKEACKRLIFMLNRKDENRKIGVIGELLMHLIVPKVFGREVESVSRLLSMQDKNIKHGFDLNYFDSANKSIWYGETKAGSHTDRKDLILRAKNGLKKYFFNVDSDKENDTNAVWDAFLIESMTIFDAGSNGFQTFKNCLLSDRDNVSKGCLLNALLMVVNFGEFENELEEIEDIKNQLNMIKRERLFNECLIISARRKLYDDIIGFIESEANS